MAQEIGTVAVLGNKHGLLSADEARVAPAFAPLIDAQVDDLNSLLDYADKRSEEIAHDGRLTAEGKAAAKRETGANLHDKIDQLARGGKNSRRRALEQAMKNLNLPTEAPSIKDIARGNGESEVITFLRHQELREALRKIDVVDAALTCKERIAAGDYDLLSAVANCSPLVCPVPAPLISELRQIYLDSQLSQGEGQDISHAMSVFDSNIGHARTAVATKLGVNAADAPARAAAQDRTMRPPLHHEQPAQRADSDSKLPKHRH